MVHCVYLFPSMLVLGSFDKINFKNVFLLAQTL